MNTFEKALDIFKTTTTNFVDFINTSTDENFIRFTATFTKVPTLNVTTFKEFYDLFGTTDCFVDEIIDHGDIFHIDFFFYQVPENIVKDFDKSYIDFIFNV